MAGNFTEVMSERSDKELIDILTINRSQYQHEAILAAEKEVERRKIDPELLAESIEQLPQEEQNQIEKAHQRFQIYHIVVTFFLPFIIIAILSWLFDALKLSSIKQYLGFPVLFLVYYLIHRGYKNNGYLKMAADFFKWTIYSLYIYIGLLILIGLIVFAMMIFSK